MGERRKRDGRRRCRAEGRGKGEREDRKKRMDMRRLGWEKTERWGKEKGERID